MSAQQLLDPAGEDSAARLADDQAEVLEQAADLVLEIALDLDQLSPAVQDRPELMTRHTLDLDLLVPTALHDPGQARGIVAVALVNLHRQRRLGVAGIDADHRQTQSPQLMPEPGRRRTGLQPDAQRAPGPCLDERGNRRRLRDHRAFRHDLATAIDHADRGFLERHVHSDIEFHSCSPDHSLRSDRAYAGRLYTTGEQRPLSIRLDPIPELRHV